MKTKQRVIRFCLIALALTAAILSITYTWKSETPQAAPKPLTFERTAARLERGRYIVEGPAHCFQCHSEVDWVTPGAQPKKGKKGAGTIFPEDALPWLVAPNITPDVETGAGSWTDAQLARAIREGIGNDGRRLFPMMPYMNFKNMSDEDLASVIVYIRSIDPVRTVVPKTQLPEPVKASLPPHEPVTGPVAGPNMSNPVERGKYLVTLGNCAFCHTPMNQQGQSIMKMAFGGGIRFTGPWGEVTSMNITPDPTGISYYDEKLFINTLRTGHVGARKLNSIMPWGYFRNMSDDDLKSIFAYLRTVKPVRHRIDNTEPATMCNTCGGKHGFGELNDSE
jgi:mono/diheme cytochrome c family protein